MYTTKVIVQNVPKRNVFVKLPFLGSTSFQIRIKFQKLFNDKSTSCNLKIVFTSPVRVKNFYTFKDKLPKMFLSGLVYRYKSGDHNATYYGKTKRHFKVWISENLGISHLTWNKVKIDNKLMAIQEQLLCCNCSPSYEEFSILTKESNDFKLKIMETRLIAHDKPCLDKANSSLPLELFWYIASMVIIWYFITSYDVHPITLWLYICCLFSFQYYVTIFLFYQKQNVWAFNINLGMTMKAAAFES